MVHECRMQGACSPSYYDRVEKLKQSMCGGIGRRIVTLERNKIRQQWYVATSQDARC